MKNWLIDVALKQMGPSAIRGGILFITGWLTVHSGVLSSFGISYDKATNIMSVNFTSLETWLTTIGLTAGGAAVIKMLNYHANDAIKSATNTILEK